MRRVATDEENIVADSERTVERLEAEKGGDSSCDLDSAKQFPVKRLPASLA